MYVHSTHKLVVWQLTYILISLDALVAFGFAVADVGHSTENGAYRGDDIWHVTITAARCLPLPVLHWMCAEGLGYGSGSSCRKLSAPGPLEVKEERQSAVTHVVRFSRLHTTDGSYLNFV